MQSLACEQGMPGQAKPLTADLLATYLCRKTCTGQERAETFCRWRTPGLWQCLGQRAWWSPCWCP